MKVKVKVNRTGVGGIFLVKNRHETMVSSKPKTRRTFSGSLTYVPRFTSGHKYTKKFYTYNGLIRLLCLLLK